MINSSISEAEWVVMEVLWEKSPLSANEIIGHIPDQKNWNPKTVKSLLSRLVKKEVISYNQEGRLYKYQPLVHRSEIVKSERKSFLDKIYRGSVNPMLAAFINDSDLSQDDISELRNLLDRKEKEMEK